MFELGDFTFKMDFEMFQNNIEDAVCSNPSEPERSWSQF